MGPERGRGRGRGRAAAATESEEEAEQPLGRLEIAEEGSGDSDYSEDGGSVAGPGGKGEGGPAEAAPGKAAAAARSASPGAAGASRAHLWWKAAATWLGAVSCPSSCIPPSPAQRSSSASPAGFGWSWVRGPWNKRV